MIPNVTLSQGISTPVIRYRPELLPAIEMKSIGGRWDNKTQTWMLPAIVSSLQSLYRLYGTKRLKLNEACQLMLDSSWGFLPLVSIDDLRYRLDDDDVWVALYPFQREALQFLLSSPHSGSLLSLSPGLGKTAVASLAARIYKARSVLIITPLSLMQTWQREIKTWTGVLATIAWGTGPTTPGWTITNYETVVRQLNKYTIPWDVVIVDESILVKNHQTKRHRAIYEIRRNTKKIWLLSGSPVSRYADDLFGQFRLLLPNAFSSYWRFAETYCYIDRSTWGSNIIGTKSSIDLQSEFCDLMFVRNQKDVLTLPQFFFESIDVELQGEQRRLYEEIHHHFITMLSDGTEMSVRTRLTQLLRLQQCVSTPANFGPEWPSASAKLTALLDLLSVGRIEFPAIIWVHWRKTAELIYTQLRSQNYSVQLVAGGVEDRDLNLRLFRDGHFDLLVVSLAVGKYGHTLTNAQTVVYYDRSWDADAYIQSLSRVQRIGLRHRPVVITLRAVKTVDELVEQNLAAKSRSIAQISNADLASLLRSIHGDHSRT